MVESVANCLCVLLAITSSLTSGQLVIVNNCLFDMLLYIHTKQLRSCREGQLLNHTVPGQASQGQFTRI